MKNFVLLFFVLLIISCKNNTNDENINEIISLMIDKRAFPLPPPPPINDTTTVLNKRTRDSLLQVKLKVVLYPTLNGFTDSQFKKIIPSKYRNILERQNNISKRITLDGIFSEKGHQIMLADTIQLKKSKDFENFDLLFWFSNFYYSKDKRKVFFELGISRSRLAGSSTCYILKKENDKWQIEYSKPHEFW